MRKAVDWLIAIQNPDGGWGEDCDSYKLDYRGYEPAPSTASQTAWALLGLMAAGEVDHPAVARGIAYLQAHAGRRRACGRRTPTPAAASRASSTCATTAIRSSSRSGRWRATATCKRSNARRVALRHVMILAATGLQRERRIVAGPGVEAVAGGGDHARLEAMLDALRRRGARHHQHRHRRRPRAGLRAGEWVVADAIARSTAIDVDRRRWTSVSPRRLPEATEGVLLGVDAIVADAAQKAALHRDDRRRRRRHGIAHRGAGRRHAIGLPFAAARVDLATPAHRTLPPAARVGMKPDGSDGSAGVLRSLLA